MRIGDHLWRARLRGFAVLALLLGLLAMHGLSSQHSMAGMFAPADMTHTTAMTTSTDGMHSPAELGVVESPRADTGFHVPALAASPMDQLMADCLAVLLSTVLLLLALMVVTGRRSSHWMAAGSPLEAVITRPPDRPPILGSLCVLRV
ncbi:DUF6153 family protein [Spongisporangium articulatum]|uniref:DUF6153 family protein n=1 Tax=Spongisporangium articulatum TaxID=3362603 RepID=A0ABW8AV62_9ACTN